MTTQGSLTRERMLAEMQQALDEEIAEKSARPNIKHSAVDGKLLSEGNGQYIYQFTLLEPWTPDDDTPLSIVNPEAKDIRCSVVTSTGTLLTIASDKALPPSLLRQIDLSDDSTELLKRQIAIDNAIMKLCELCKSANRADLLRDGQVVRYGAVQKAELKTNPEYAEVYLPKIAQSLGVTTLERQKAVKAELEQVRQKLASILQLQQSGSKPLEQQLSEITAQIAHWNQTLVPLKQEEQRHIAHLREQQGQYAARCNHLQREATQSGQQLARAKVQEEERKRELEYWRQQEQQTVARLVEAWAMSGIKRFFKGIKMKTLEGQVAQCSNQA